MTLSFDHTGRLSSAQLEPYGFAEDQELIEAKKRGERTELDAVDRDRWLS